MIRRPPRSTLFPTRRSSDLLLAHRREHLDVVVGAVAAHGLDVELLEPLLHALERGRVRSEEHTSELQSQSNLVCRLLLEKKKKTKRQNKYKYIVRRLIRQP